MVRYLITGGAGFIGSRLAQELVKRNHEVIIYDNFSTGSRSNLNEIIDEIKIVEGDIRDSEKIRETLSTIDNVFHLAANPSAVEAKNNVIESNSSIVEGSLILMNEIAQIKRKIKIVQASSCAVYGELQKQANSEEQQELPANIYGLAKLVSEQYAQLYYQDIQLSIISLRYFNVFGSGQNPASLYSAVIPCFAKKINEGKTIQVFGDKKKTRDFIHVKDIVRATILAMDATVDYAVLNICSGKRTTLEELIQVIEKITGKKAKISYEKERLTEIQHSVGDPSKAKKLIGFESTTSLYEGLLEVIKNNKKEE